MKVIKKKLSELRRPKKNVRNHSIKQIEEFKRSVQMFGQIRPIVIDEDNVILAGNGLFMALEALGRTEADCYVAAGLTEAGKKKLMLADNRIFNLGVDDLQAFEEIILELDHDFDIPGYDADLLETLVIDVGAADTLMGGYGIISDDTKQEMERAGERYAKEDQSFADAAERIIPTQSESPHSIAGNDSPSIPEEAVSALADQPDLPQRFMLCPKCGEKIWL
jgi:hypothetical protein